MTITLFSFGYWGWGNATERLVAAIDAAERARGFHPPVFVDIRLRRQGRARGFVGSAFRDLVGESRYRWMEDLGNAEIATGSGGIRIKRTEAVADLLELALQKAKEGRRVIFYCACQPPWDKGLRCHRYKVASLALKRAERWGRPVEIVEWPGGKPATVQLDVKGDLVKALRNGRKSLPIRNGDWCEFVGLPWGSIVRLRAKEESVCIASGPARYSNGWFLPVIEEVDPSEDASLVKRAAERFRQRYRLEP